MLRRLAPALALALACRPDAPAGDDASAGTTAGDGSSSGSGGGSTAGVDDGRLTYYRDAKAVLDAHCANCHRPGDIGPFALDNAEDAVMWAPVLPAAIEAGLMPPWPPSPACNVYEHERALPADARELLLRWIAEGAAVGDPADAPPPLEPDPPIAWDLELPLPEPFTPTRLPDDYRCFVLEWPEDQLKYIVGVDVAPEQPSIVHHVIAFLIPPGSASYYRGLDDAEAGPGYTCFGSPGAGFDQQWVASWAPGVTPRVDDTRGIPVQPDSVIVLQLHYHPTPDPPADRTALRVKLADTVETPMHVIPYTNPDWLGGGVMRIPAGDASVVHSFAVDLTQWIGDFFPDAGVDNGQPFVVHGAGLHMHTRGKQASIKLLRKGGGSDCALYVPRWDFDWQGGYRLQEPLVVNPGDRLELTCEWDNSAANQPVVDGEQQAPVDLDWGEGTGDEMCLAVLTISPKKP